MTAEKITPSQIVKAGPPQLWGAKNKKEIENFHLADYMVLVKVNPPSESIQCVDLLRGIVIKAQFPPAIVHGDAGIREGFMLLFPEGKSWLAHFDEKVLHVVDTREIVGWWEP